jgi:Uma2 family endonuclease
MNMLAPEDLRPFKLRIEDYELLDGAGAFAMQRVELIEGVVVTVNSEHLPHTRLKNELMFRLRLALRERGMAFDAFVEASLALPPYNMPDADIVVAHAHAQGTYLGTSDIAIVIEVSASSLRADLGVKKRLYAEHAVPEYWVADVSGRQVHQFWAPEDGDYRNTRIVPLAGRIRSVTLPDLIVSGAGIL